jgi:hypothetical protein
VRLVADERERAVEPSCAQRLDRPQTGEGRTDYDNPSQHVRGVRTRS